MWFPLSRLSPSREPLSPSTIGVNTLNLALWEIAERRME